MATIFESGMAGYRSGLEAQSARTQIAAKTSLMKSQAEMAAINVDQAKAEAAAKMSLMAAERKVSADATDLNLGSLQGRAEMLKRVMTAPEIRDNPRAMSYLTEEYNNNITAQSKEAIARSQIRTDQLEGIYTRLGGIQSTGADSQESLTSLNDLIKSAPDEDTKRQLTGLLHIYNGSAPVPGTAKKYSELSPTERNNFDRRILGFYESGKNNQALVHQIQTEATRQDRADETARHNKANEVLKAQDIATKREKYMHDISFREAKLRDHSKDIASQHVSYANDVNKIEEKQSKILQAAGVSDPDEKTTNWWGSEYSKLSASDKAAYTRLEAEKEQRTQAYDAALAKLQASDQTPKPTSFSKATIPARPSGVPSGAQYSPSQGKWWWQENGQWKSK